MPNTPIPIGSDRQLLLDRRLIDELQDARQVLHQPMRRNAAVRIDHPWEEGGLAYCRALQRRGPLPRLVPLHPPRRQQQNRPILHRLRRKQRRHLLAQTRTGPHRLPRLDGQ